MRAEVVNEEAMLLRQGTAEDALSWVPRYHD